MRLSFRSIVLTHLTVLLVTTPALAGSIKKWVDENGVVHYGTAIPPQYSDKTHSELNQRGIEIKCFERAKTPEEIERDKALAALRAEQQKRRQQEIESEEKG